MAASTPPRVVNWTTVTGLCTVFTFIMVLGGLLCAAAYYVGYQARQIQELQQKQEAIAADEKRRKELEIYNSRQTDEKDGHAIKEQKKK